MRKIIQRFLVATAVIASMCGSAAAEEPGKDWYVALRFGYQPYQLEVQGKLAGRDFDRSASLSDIMDKTDTTIFGGEVEYGRGKWFTTLGGFYQKSEVSKSNGIDGADVTFKEYVLNPMVGYRVVETKVGEMPLLVDAMAGLQYVKVKLDASLYSPILGNISGNRDFNFTDPMLGARAYLEITRKFGVASSFQLGGFGVGSEVNTVLAGNVVYNFTDWFAMSGGYKYWYFKYENDEKTLSRYEQTIHGPVLGVQFKF